MGYIEPKTDFKDGDILYGIDLNASNEVIKAGVDDNFDKIKELQNNKQNNLTAGEGIDITDNVISNTQTSAEWGNIIGTLTDQSDLLNALNDKQELLKSGINIKTINNQSLLGAGNISISGTGGTSNYNDLENRPQINNITLAGNKTLEDLGIDIPTKISDLINDNDTVTDSNYVHTDSNYTSAEKIKLAGIESGAQVNVDEIVFDENEATEDTKLIIEPFDFQPSDVANEYSTDIHRAYSCDYINEELNNTNKIIYANDFKSKNLVQSFKSGSSSIQYAVCLNAVADLKPNTTYTIQFKGANNHVVYFNESLFTTNPRINCNGMVQSMTLTTLATLPTISSNGYAILKNVTGNTVVPNFTDVQIELGEEATSYTKYKNFDNSGDILWSNSNPTDDFSNQTITLNSSDYDAYELIYARSKSQNIRYSTGRIPKGSSFNIFVFAGEESGGYLSYRYRNLNYVSDTSLSVSNCIQKIVNETTTGTANATCIPLYIIGYKTGLFR